MYVASNFSWCQSHLFNQCFGILWPLTPRLSHSTCATARRVTSLSCQLHSALLQWLWCLGVWPHGAPDCSPGRVLEKVGEATCHCPTAMEESGGPGAQHDCWKYNTWCCQRPFQLGGERKRESKTKWLHGCDEWQCWLLRSEKLCLWRQQSHSGPIFLLLNQVQAITWNDWTISQSQILWRHHKLPIMCLCFRCCFWAATTPKGEKGDNGKSSDMLYEVFLWK